MLLFRSKFLKNSRTICFILTGIIEEFSYADKYYTQYPIIRNGLIRNDAEISVNFKKPTFKGSSLRNA